MLTTILTLVLGTIMGLFLTFCSLLWLIKAKCPKCKQPRPLKQIIFLHWKERLITGQPCLKCQQVKPKIDVF